MHHAPSPALPLTLLLSFAAGCRAPMRGSTLHAVAGMAATNNPSQPQGDSDNLANGLGGRLRVLTQVTARVDAMVGDFTYLTVPSLTYDFRLAGPDGPGAIDAHVGIGGAFLARRENGITAPQSNNLLGNDNTLVLRLGAEGYLVGGLLGGVALLVAPVGYDGDDAAVAGLFTVGITF